MKNSVEVPQEIKHRIIIWPRNSIPRYTPMRNENIFTQKLVHFTAALFICKQKVKKKN